MPVMSSYVPQWDRLQPYVSPESGINTPDKAYAFVIGVLYGKLQAHMAMRGVNINANGLSLLKRFTLKSQDLPALYTRIHSKLIIYGALGNEHLRALLTEFTHLAVLLGDRIELTDVQTVYYLLLGMSVSQDIVPSNGRDASDPPDQNASQLTFTP